MSVTLQQGWLCLEVLHFFDPAMQVAVLLHALVIMSRYLKPRDSGL